MLHARVPCWVHIFHPQPYASFASELHAQVRRSERASCAVGAPGEPGGAGLRPEIGDQPELGPPVRFYNFFIGGGFPY